MDEEEYKAAAVSNYNTLLHEAYASINYRLMREVGPLEALVFSVLLSKEHYHRRKGDLTEDGFFYETADHLEQKINLSRHKQTACIQTLVEKSLLITDIRGQDPPKRHFQIRHDVLYTLMKSIFKEFENREIPDTSIGEDKSLIFKEFKNRNLRNLKQVTIKDNEKKSDVKDPSGLYTTPRSAELHPRKKILINRNSPLVIEEEPTPHLNKPHIRKIRRVLVPKKSDDVLDIFEYWSSKGFPIHQEKTKSEAKAVRDIYALLDGTLFDSFKDKGVIRKYRVLEVKKSIDNYALAAFHRDYQPSNVDLKKRLQHIGLCNFFYDAQKGGESNKSMFLRYFFSKPKLISESTYLAKRDELPHITKVLSRWYYEKFSNRGNGNSVQDINSFIRASLKLKQFMEDNGKNLKLEDFHMMYGCYDNLKCLAIQLTRTMDKELRENDILWRDFHPGWLLTEKTFVERLPKFLKSEHMMK